MSEGYFPRGLIILYSVNSSVPEADPSGKSMILNYGDYLRLKNAAQVLTEGEKQAAVERAKYMKEAAMVSWRNQINHIQA